MLPPGVALLSQLNHIIHGGESIRTAHIRLRLRVGETLRTIYPEQTAPDAVDGIWNGRGGGGSLPWELFSHYHLAESFG